MRPGNPLKIADGVHQLQALGARVTVMPFDDGTVMVDAGFRGSFGRISSGLRAMGLSPDQVGLVVLTHCHPDHAGGLARVVEASSALVAAHREDAAVVGGTQPLPNIYRSQLMASLTRPLMPQLYGAPVDVDYVLEDGARLPVREEVRVVHVPGHTAGSICLHLPSKGVVIVGDALQYRSGRLSGPASSVTQDPKLAMESLEKLLSLDFDTICFSHFPPLTRGARSALRRLLDSSSSI